MFSKMKPLNQILLLIILVQYCLAGTTFVAKDATLYDANGNEFIIRMGMSLYFANNGIVNSVKFETFFFKDK